MDFVCSKKGGKCNGARGPTVTIWSILKGKIFHILRTSDILGIRFACAE